MKEVKSKVENNTTSRNQIRFLLLFLTSRRGWEIEKLNKRDLYEGSRRGGDLDNYEILTKELTVTMTTCEIGRTECGRGCNFGVLTCTSLGKRGSSQKMKRVSPLKH